MMIAARNAFLMSKPTARDYVQNGLVAMWDGIENAGWGVHSATTNTWVDLLGNYDAIQRQNSGWHWEKDAYVGTQQNGHGFVVPIGFTNWFKDNFAVHTAEFGFRPSENVRMVWMGNFGLAASGLGITWEYASHRNYHFRIYYSGIPDADTLCWNPANFERKYCAVISTNATNDRNGKQFYVSGLPSAIDTFTWNSAVSISRAVPSDSFLLGGDIGRPGSSILGELCFARFYSRALTAAEIAANYAVDAARFGL